MKSNPGVPELYIYTQNFIYGYAKGFNAGLTDGKNLYPLMESEWRSDERLDIKKMRQELVDRYNKSGILPDKMETFYTKCSTDNMPPHYKIGYNWGYDQGQKTRTEYKADIPGEDFERCMTDLALVLDIQLLVIHRNTYPMQFGNADPEREKKSRLRIISDLMPIRTLLKEEETACLEPIRELAEQNSIQQAIDKGMQLFREKKVLPGYASLLNLKAGLIHLRNEKKSKLITDKEYNQKISQIKSTITDTLNEYGNHK